MRNFCTLRSTGATDISSEMVTAPSTVSFPLKVLTRLFLGWDQLTSRSLNLRRQSSPRYCPAHHANSGRQLNLWDHMMELRACSQTTMVQPICVLWGILAGHELDLKTNWRSDCIISYISSGPQLVKLRHFGIVGWIGHHPKVSSLDGMGARLKRKNQLSYKLDLLNKWDKAS